MLQLKEIDKKDIENYFQIIIKYEGNSSRTSHYYKVENRGNSTWHVFSSGDSLSETLTVKNVLNEYSTSYLQSLIGNWNFYKIKSNNIKDRYFKNLKVSVNE